VGRLRRQSLTITDAGETWSSWTGTGTWNRWASTDLPPLGAVIATWDVVEASSRPW